MIKFNRPVILGSEGDYLQRAFDNGKLTGDGPFNEECGQWFEDNFGCAKALLATSCTAALEMAAILCNIQPGDEVIMPSYTFVSTANAFVLRGAKIVFVDVRPDTMNIDENLIEAAITDKTKAIAPVHYAGVACEMDRIMEIAREHNLKVIEDAAQGMMAKYKGKWLGTIGDIGCYSFHETKNYTCGEGGAILLNDEALVERAEIIREKGTNRSKFFRGQVDKYTWVDVGSSYLPSELNAAYLIPQLKKAQAINEDRLKSWELYFELLSPLAEASKVELPVIPEGCEHNAHMFYLKVKDLQERTALLKHLREHEIGAVFHYIPLHSSTAGQEFGVFYGEDRYTTKDSERLFRLPMYYGLAEKDIKTVVQAIEAFYL
ncbi:dTDP-4-amino-4,6-dideoxygalactose transaminase [Candidatus Peregrinibacteria bacterium]|jgi:dTDP-4-amino-4,6-dideoxygalactose transaminase|nr:dTDP-4-amino-4,6-dideoxygalactose transaminase [Candidatus Peregrinibacteria bacterium]MBT7703664.1 dTDP-4-amino-4,6-dideoxygalactose transaminase [Candidatus Peregrinibacteria bacterium]